MPKYCPIFKTPETANSQALLAEFSAAMSNDFKKVYDPLDAWKGVRVFDLHGTNRIAELPELGKIVDKIGRQHIIMINYYNLEKRSRQHAHRDMFGNLLCGVSRLHIPLQTNPQAVLEIEKQAFHLGLNEVWCLDTSGLHAAYNDGTTDRIHLVIDVKKHADTLR